MNKSKKLQQVKEGHDTLIIKMENGRYAKVWQDQSDETYILSAGYDGMGEDYREEHDDFDKLEASMRELGNMRRWAFDYSW